MTEAQITKAITDWLNTLPECWWFKIHGHHAGKLGGQKAGVPDLCIIYKGATEWVEVKTEKGKLSPVQEKCIEGMQKAGGRISIVRSLEEVQFILIGGGASS